MERKVLVAMSGGVDSCAAALLLKEQGCSLLGGTLDLRWRRRDLEADEPEDLADARRAAERMGIPHVAIPMGEEFRRQVVAPFVEAYLSGQTPNPCVECNLKIKFGQLLEAAFRLGQDFLATGHYARCCQDPETGRWLVKKGADHTKDQSYVLWQLTQRQLSHTLFPVGEFRKEEIRDMVEKAGLENARKPDSQDICFIPQGDYGAFLEEYLGRPLEKGNYLDMEGRVLGKHRGMARYTMGQRKGLGIALGAPAYVVSKDPVSNTVTLGKESELYCTRFWIRDPNWISIPALEKPVACKVKTRYTQRETPALVHPYGEGRALVELEKPERAVTPGQSAVFYDGEILVGGGFILGQDKE